MARVIFRKTFSFINGDFYVKPWMISINDKENVIKLIEIVNKSCIGKNLCKAIKNNLSFNNIQDITRELCHYKRNMAPSPSKVLRRPWTWIKPHAVGKTR